MECGAGSKNSLDQTNIHSYRVKDITSHLTTKQAIDLCCSVFFPINLFFFFQSINSIVLKAHSLGCQLPCSSNLELIAELRAGFAKGGHLRVTWSNPIAQQLKNLRPKQRN